MFGRTAALGLGGENRVDRHERVAEEVHRDIILHSLDDGDG